MRSLSAALEHAIERGTSDLAKKSKGRPQHETSSPHGSLVHSSFPQPGGINSSFMGSQSSPPGSGMSGGMPSMGAPSGMPSMGEEPGAYGPGY